MRPGHLLRMAIRQPRLRGEEVLYQDFHLKLKYFVAGQATERGTDILILKTLLRFYSSAGQVRTS